MKTSRSLDRVRLRCCRRVLVVVVGACIALSSRAAQAVTLHFETDDNGVVLVNGQDISTPPEFGNYVRISALSGSHRGPAIFDSTPGGPNAGGADPDLLVGLGNILILQESSRGTQTVPGIFNTPNDDADGGTLVFEFTRTVRMSSIDLIDVDSGCQAVKVRIFDKDGDERTYWVPKRWTKDIAAQGPNGYDTLDLTTLMDQTGEGGSTATAWEDRKFSENCVVKMKVTIYGSGALDNVVFEPTCCKDSDCDDGDPCTIDDCVDGECVHVPVDCDDGDPCTIDECVPVGPGLRGGDHGGEQEYECVHTPMVCDDGDPCTEDSCEDGECVFTPIVCDDGDPCTEDACVDGECVFTPIVCDDGDPCTEDSCVDGECVFMPIVCDDGDPCTEDACVDGECVYTPMVCDDGDPCTQDFCEEGECRFVPKACDPPAIICPPDVTIECDEPIEPEFTGQPDIAVIDAAGCGEDIVITFEDTSEQVDACTTVLTRTWTATDGCNTAATCAQTITIADTVPPSIECEAVDAVLAPDGTAFVVLIATITDNCCVMKEDVVLTTEASEEDPNALIFTVDATDCCGNVGETCQDTAQVTPPSPVAKSVLGRIARTAFSDPACVITQVDPRTVTIVCDVNAFLDCNANNVPDSEEPDSDGDGIIDECDSPEFPVPDCNDNGIDDREETDTDGDGVIDDCDNCVEVSNPDQADSDGDGLGDACTPTSQPSSRPDGDPACGAGLCGFGSLGMMPWMLLGLAAMKPAWRRRR